MSKEKLLQLKTDIDTAKVEVSKIKGKKELLENQLKTQFGCSTIEEAEEKVKQLQKKIDKLSTSIEEGIQELEEKYNINLDDY